QYAGPRLEDLRHCARRNRVGTPAHRRLTTRCDVPTWLANDLSRRAKAAALRGAAMAREAVRLHRALAAAGIEIMDLKGAPPAALAYGELGLKESADIDHLAAPAAVVDATHVLVELGYEISFLLEDRELARLV